MVHTTLVSAGGKVIIQRPTGVSLMQGYTNGSDILPGSLVTGDGMTSPDLNLIDADGEWVSGVAVRMTGTAATTAPDTAFTDNEPFEYAPTGSGIVCYAKFTSNNGWYPGQILVSAGNGTGEGTLEEAATVDSLTTTYTNLYNMFGRGVEFEADTSTGSGGYTYVWAQVRLSL